MLTYTLETIAKALDDLGRLIPEQWQYTGDPTIPCEPLWTVYTALEAKGGLALFMARRDERAIGYATAMLHPHMNSRRVLVGTIPTYHVEECPSRGLIMRGLVEHAREWLVKHGAQQVFAETEYEHSAGRLLEQMGFVPHKIGYKMVPHGDAIGPVQ